MTPLKGTRASEDIFGTAKLDDLAAKVGRSAAPVYEVNDWRWRGSETPPDAAQIAAQVRGMFARAESEHSLSCGRLRVTRYKDEMGIEYIDISLDLGGLDNEDDPDA